MNASPAPAEPLPEPLPDPLLTATAVYFFFDPFAVAFFAIVEISCLGWWLNSFGASPYPQTVPQAHTRRRARSRARPERRRAGASPASPRGGPRRPSDWPRR